MLFPLSLQPFKPTVMIDCPACKGTGKTIGPAAGTDERGRAVRIPLGSGCPICRGLCKIEVEIVISA